uniref:Uncharacterized protein n=1 Tax=Panagrolaimus sp. ES5 TaxID=591445 RepID=A0AC34GTH6_9BILA
MTKGRRLARSVSLNVPPPNLTNSQITPLPILRPPNSKSLKSKVVKFMTTKLFVNQVHSESTQTFTSSNFQVFVYFLRFIGLSYKIHQKETKSLIIKRYSLSQNLDHLIYRYQSIEKSVRMLEQNYSTVILAFIIATVAGVFLDEFRTASHKLSDLQQQDSYCITSMKLLSFMLRLSYDTERIRVGKVFAITPQATVIFKAFICFKKELSRGGGFTFKGTKDRLKSNHG